MANKNKKYKRSLENAGTVADYIDAIYSNNPKEEFLGEPEHHYDFTQSEEWANAHGYYPDKRGHRDDMVKKPAHPSHPSKGIWEGNNFILTNKGLADPNYIFFGLNDGGQDPQAILKYKDTYVFPEFTVTPKGNYINNSYDNIRLHFKKGGIHTSPSKRSIEDAGRISDEEYYNIMERVAERNYRDWGLPNPDAALLQALNDNSYNYRGYYNKYPNGDGNAKDHWTDEFKTVYHPTFSDESIYSGKKSQYNPNGLKGGTWIGEIFMPRYWQRNKKENGGIHIASSKCGTFTAAATKHGMEVQEFASRVLRNKDSYSPAMVKKANFARNASKWH